MCVCGAKFISTTVPCRALADKASPNQTARERGGDAEPAFLFQKDEPTVSSHCCCFPGVTQPTCSTRDSRTTSTGLQCSVWSLHIANPSLVTEVKDTSLTDVCSRVC